MRNKLEVLEVTQSTQTTVQTQPILWMNAVYTYAICRISPAFVEYNLMTMKLLVLVMVTVATLVNSTSGASVLGDKNLADTYCGRVLLETLHYTCTYGIEEGVYISNLNGACFRCLCHVAGCDMNRGCSDGYCGPYFISRVYWVDAGRPTLPDDDPTRKEAFEDCARDFYCSMKIIENYMAKFGRDCNGDGVTNCFDYMMINYHGGSSCTEPLFLTGSGRKWLAKFQECRFN